MGYRCDVDIIIEVFDQKHDLVRRCLNGHPEVELHTIVWNWVRQM